METGNHNTCTLPSGVSILRPGRIRGDFRDIACAGLGLLMRVQDRITDGGDDDEAADSHGGVAEG